MTSTDSNHSSGSHQGLSRSEDELQSRSGVGGAHGDDASGDRASGKSAEGTSGGAARPRGTQSGDADGSELDGLVEPIEVDSVAGRATGAGDFTHAGTAFGSTDGAEFELGPGLQGVPRQIGEYAIERLLGAGGMGRVYRAVHQRMHRVVEHVLSQHEGDPDFGQAERVLREFENAPPESKNHMLDQMKAMGAEAVITKAQRKELRAALKRQLVKRNSLMKIVSAWIITVPVSAFLAALFFFALRGMMLP